MKSIIFLISSVFIFHQSNAQKETIIRLNTNIDSATIYLKGAEIARSKAVKLAAGRNLLFFEGLSSKIDPRSIRVTTGEDVSLLRISGSTNFLSKVDENPRIKQLKDSVELLNIRISQLNDENNALTLEKEMLLKNNSIGGTSNGVVINELKAASEFFRTRILDLNMQFSDKTRKAEKIQQALTRINRELNELNASYTFERYEIAVLLACERELTTNVQVKYIVSDAGWAPSYDIKATDINKPVELIYRAKVFNNTGIDWNNIKIKLSTADPTLSVSKPIMNPWNLNFSEYKQYSRGDFQQNQGYMQNIISNMPVTNDNLVSQTGPVKFTQIEVPELSAEFDIKTRYTIPSDAKPYLVDVSNAQLPAKFKHYAVTKIDRDVFLLAQITGWEELNLIEGSANVYYAGTYLGESYINTRNVSDTLDLSLGRDKKVIVTRTKLKDYSDKQFLGSKVTETFVYEMIAKNNRKTPIDIEILDQIPISQTEEIEVKTLEISNAIYNSVTGALIWKYNLQPGQSEKIKLSFSIKYPKNKKQEIILERKRSMSSPNFK